MIDPFLVALANCPVFGCRSLDKLFAHFPSAQAIWEASEVDFLNVDIPQGRLDAFFTFRKQTRPETYVELMNKNEIRLITKDDAEYPPLLKTIFDPPFVLFLRGAPLKEMCISIVGSRSLSDYGKKSAKMFATGIAGNGISIVSGLATGIDTVAHQGAIEAGGHTVAVLGGGLLAHNSMDREGTSKKILATGGTVITEFGFHSPFIKYHFPMRNRIIAGMSRITLVVEAALPSGSLTTAQAATDAGREVFAVPGPIDSLTSAGTNDLIKNGAFVATCPNDILLAFGIASPKNAITHSGTTIVAANKPLPELPPLLKTICSHLENGSLFADELCLKTSSTAPQISCALLELELMSLVRHLGGTRYERI